MTNNDNIKNFDDVSRHLELEIELLEAVKPKILAYIAEFGLHKVFRPKCKKSKIGINSEQIKKSIRNFSVQQQGQAQKEQV